MKKNVVLVGASGRMGKEIAALLNEHKNLKISGEVSRKGFGKIKDADVVIDFSMPEFTETVVKWCSDNKVPLVSGVTGLAPQQHKMFEALSKKVAVLWAPNMSLGVALLNSIIANLPELSGFDVQLEEFHHNKKKDHPSGTALMLQKTIKSKFKNAPDPVSIRGGGIPGTHNVYLMGEEEVLTIGHQALNRRVFARGAVQVAEWITKQKPGKYTIEDLLEG